MTEPKILIYDIETSPNVGYFWRPGNKVRIGYENILEERKIICICYKWFGQKKTYSLDWGKEQCDKKLLEKFSKIMQEADATVGHNSDRFDYTFIKGRMLYHRLPPFGDITRIDTLKLARANFNLNSNRLDYIAQYLTGEGKLATGFSLWKEVMTGKKKALKEMIAYCKQDVEILEDVYKEIRAHSHTTPFNASVARNGTREGCPMCGSNDLRKDGFKLLRAGRYQVFQCKECAHKFRSHKMEKRKR